MSKMDIAMGMVISMINYWLGFYMGRKSK